MREKNNRATIEVAVHDARTEIDGKYYGDYSRLAVRTKNVPLAEAVQLVSDRFDAREQARITVYVLKTDLIEWACRIEGYSAPPAKRGKGSREVYKEIAGIAGGYKLATQRFLDRYGVWVTQNADPAEAYLRALCENKGRKDVVQAINRTRQMDSQQSIDSAWKEVARLLGMTPNWQGSWNAIKGAPINIVEWLQENKGREWKLTGATAYRPITEKPILPSRVEAYQILPDRILMVAECKMKQEA